MKRVVCLLLCAVMLLGLLPAAALAGGELQMYFETCDKNGNVPEEQRGRFNGLGSMYGDSIFFHAYTAETDGVAITGDQLCLYENNEPDTSGMLTWIPSENNGYYKWDTHAAKAADPVFLATINGQRYKGRAQVHEAEVGWFSSGDKSISTALTYGFATDANVYYDGTKDVTVYLTADFSFTTTITLDEVTSTNNGIQLALEDRGEFNGYNLGSLLKVTCPADLSGVLTVTVPVDLCYNAMNDKWSDTYTVTFSEFGKKPGGDMPSQPGEPTAIKVKLKDEEGNVKEETCWFGVGEFANNKYDILSNSSMGNPADSPNYAILAVGLWRKNEYKNGSWDLTMLSPKEAEEVMTQADFQLNFYPLSGQAADDLPEKKQLSEIIEPDYPYGDLIQAAAAAAETGMPEAACYLLEAKHEGKWRVEAVCEMKESGETYTACGNLERRVSNNVINLNDCTTVTEINDKLTETFNNLPNSSKWRETNICVLLKESEYTGQIVVPDIPDGYMEVNVEFVGDIRNGTGTPLVELHGGICSNSAPIAVQKIRFIGAGKKDDGSYWETWPEEKWPKGTANYGAKNSALYGNSMATAGSCEFTGYYYAMKLTKEMRLCGENNTYVENHIAWYLGEGNYNGGNPHANNCVFERNDIAIQIENFNLRPSFYAPSRCQFIDNEWDIQNNSGRAWFIPGNYFVHGSTDDGRDYLATAIEPATLVNCYPLCRREIINGKERDVFYYNYKQLGRDEIYRLANRLASTYQTPLAYLDGKTFEVVDEDSAQPLATFTFDSADSPAQQRAPAARRSIARFSAEEEKSFDATVRVDRTDEQIDFTMNDPCRSVTVKLPCDFKYGTVTHNGEILNASFAGETVSFKTNEGGTYEIHASASTHVIAAGYNALGQLVGVQILSNAKARANIPGAVTVKIFTLDSSYRPIAEYKTQTNK